MASQATRLQRFKAAMEKVYGNFEDIAKWRVPPLPGNAGDGGRYLWTDAFGVVNFVTLWHTTGEDRYLEAAKRLVQTVHNTLGRTRDGSSRLPGASDAEPLKGGLRIGKVDEAGPDGDGQYHHYLTLWMFALSCLAVALEDAQYNDLAIQLAQAIHPRFIVSKSSGELSMVWKLSTDMSRHLSRSKGHLDDVTGYVVFERLTSTACWFGQNSSNDDQPSLAKEMEQYWSMMERSRPLQSSADLLDLGMSLWVAHFQSRQGDEMLRELGAHGKRFAHVIFIDRIDGPYSLLQKSAGRRLAFRELGGCLGIKCYAKDDADLVASADAVVEFWENHVDECTPDDLLAITEVMLAAALLPGGEIIPLLRKTLKDFVSADHEYPQLSIVLILIGGDRKKAPHEDTS